jgi:F420-dependent oxidoreductase-like protein
MTDGGLRLPDPTLVVLVGPSGSGKSSWAAAHFEPDQVVSSDRLRAMVGEGEHDLAASADAFAVLDAVVEARVRRRLTTVVDTLGLDAARRAGWRALAAGLRVPCVAVAFDTPAAECRRRNSSRDHRVPADVLSGQLAAYAEQRPALAAEGFDQVIEPGPVRVVPAVIARAADAIGVGAPRAGESGAGAHRADQAGARLRFGLHLSAFGVPGGPAALAGRLAEVARAAEGAGFDSLWVMDHLRQIPQVGRPWDDLLESTTALGYLAAATERIRLGCLVHCITFRQLAHLAKIVATLDVLSGGRAWCGLGAGWDAAEHAGYGIPFPPDGERLDLLEDALGLLPLMWGPGGPAFTGRRVQVAAAACYPRPLQARIPLLVGGSGERRTLALAARHADACNLIGDPDRVRHKVSVLHRHCDEAGRDRAEVEVTHLSTALVADSPGTLRAEVARLGPRRDVRRWSERVSAGTVDDHVLRVRALQQAGVQHVIVSLPGVWDSPAVETFGAVIAALRD